MNLAKFQSTHKRIAVNIIQCDTPANDAEDQDQISPETLIRIEERKKLKNILNNSRTRAVKQTAGEAYTRTNREVKRSVRIDKRNLQQEQSKLQVRITSKLFMITSNS